MVQVLSLGLNEHILTADPHFVDVGAGNLRLRSESPAIGAGVRLSDVPDDFAGTPRPVQGGHALGAYEPGSGRGRPSGPPIPKPHAPRNLRLVTTP